MRKISLSCPPSSPTPHESSTLDHNTTTVASQRTSSTLNWLAPKSSLHTSLEIPIVDVPLHTTRIKSIWQVRLRLLHTISALRCMLVIFRRFLLLLAMFPYVAAPSYHPFVRPLAHLSVITRGRGPVLPMHLRPTPPAPHEGKTSPLRTCPKGEKQAAIHLHSTTFLKELM